MQHPNLHIWEQKLKAVFDRINDELEERYGSRYPLHPARPPHGATSSRDQDGLFDLGAVFSAGFGSAHGPGYVVEVRLATLSAVPREVKTAMEEEVVRRLRAELPRAFPGRRLQVERDGSVFKIIGDLSLDRV
jgi:hypothetical protein